MPSLEADHDLTNQKRLVAAKNQSVQLIRPVAQRPIMTPLPARSDVIIAAACVTNDVIVLITRIHQLSVTRQCDHVRLQTQLVSDDVP